MLLSILEHDTKYHEKITDDEDDIVSENESENVEEYKFLKSATFLCSHSFISSC